MNDANLEGELRNVQKVALMVRNGYSNPFLGPTTFTNMLATYMASVNAQQSSVRKRKAVDIVRFTPTFQFTSNTLRKLIVKDNLNTYYRTSYPSAHWAYTNYNCLNFYTSSAVPTSSVLLYPNVGGPGSTSHVGYNSGTYALSGAFSFDFYINPRYQQAADAAFKAGTIFHLSSAYALSLVTGSAKDHNGRSVGFRLQLQLSSSTDTPPSLAAPGGAALTYRSDDNALRWNRWHHCVVRWGTALTNGGTGSFNVDGVDRGFFVIPSGTVASQVTGSGPGVLAVGNYYEGFGDPSSFFAADPALRDGLVELDATTGVETPPGVFHFRHPLNAEVHDLAIKRYYMSDVDIQASATQGPASIDVDRIAFYLPPFFVQESPFRRFVGDHGGIFQTPFFEVDGTTDDPFNAAMSFGVGGHMINAENFVRDFASNVFPRLHHMTGVAITSTTEAREANDFLYDQPFVRRLNTLIMPCDDGLFVPRFELLASETNRAKLVDDLGLEELSFIGLDNMVSTASLLFGTVFDATDKGDTEANRFVDELVGYSPEYAGKAPGSAVQAYANRVAKQVVSGNLDAGIQDGAPLTVFNRTRDPSSNQVTFFDISNLFYGKRILPGSLTIRDGALSGSGGAISVTLKDDGRGNLYRSDSFTSASTWNSVGNVYYDEGILVVKSPHLYFFGSEQFEVSFRGEQNIHVLKMDALAPANSLNSSSNPNFRPLNPTGFPNDVAEFVYISALNFHDDNYNVVAKAQLSQPIVKREGDRVMFKVAFDF
jgi:hypothetical protein